MLPAHRLVTFAVLAAGVASTQRVQAQGPSEAAATALFDEGRKLMAESRYSEACPRLAESQRLAPSGGTLLNLADCYEHTGQTASAWAAWKDAAARASAAGKVDVEKRALSRAAALEPVLPRLTISIDAASNTAGLEVKRDGVTVGPAEFGLAIPVDPGSHVVEATAPRKKAFSTRLAVVATQTDARVTVALEDAPAPPASAAPLSAQPSFVAPPVTPPSTPGEAPSSSGWSTRKTVGLVVGIAGVAGLVAGSVFGVEAASKNNQALEPQNCRTSALCSPTGLALTNDARSAATLSTVSFVAGGVLVAAGAVVWLTAPSSPTAPRTGMRLVPLVTASTGGLALDGGW